MIVSPVVGSGSVHGRQTPVATIDEGGGGIAMETKGGDRFYRAKNSAISIGHERAEQNDGTTLGWVQKTILDCMRGGFKC